MQGEPQAVEVSATSTRQGALPNTESVRQAALAASWRRDRAVARRRLAWRWAGWYLWRSLPYLLVAGALLATGVYLWHAGTVPSGPRRIVTETAPTPSTPLTLHPDKQLHSQEP
ncbi:MAG: hypothetical protein WCS60_00755 [Hydrogenophaga sp.]|jgi:hypothetical protein|uniref:hypothetical protein n=1 Tax=Hydrogenophaga sp. TaxID=1904254 RepID=UPI000EBDB1D0|nr:hypothetical protein [Hydrogenophaga sp.]MDX9968253.1 hypothetical protein [Hydrogenophaga sp.]HAJ11196.1 hypothetical protein [Comamonadaceae bacterium]